MKTRIKIITKNWKDRSFSIFIPQRKVFLIFWTDSFPIEDNLVLTCRAKTLSEAREFIKDMKDWKNKIVM